MKKFICDTEMEKKQKLTSIKYMVTRVGSKCILGLLLLAGMIVGIPKMMGQTSIVGFSTADSGSGTATSLSVNLPANVTANDILILHLNARADNVNVSTPSGWTAIDTLEGDGMTSVAFYKFYSSGDPSSYTVSFGSARSFLSLTAVRGISKTNPINARGVTPFGNSSTTSHTSPAVTTTVANARVLVFIDVVNGSNTTVLNSPLTTVYALQGATGALGAYNTLGTATFANAGSTGSFSATSNSAVISVVRTLALAPASTYSISGTVTLGGNGLSGVTISATGGHTGSTTTNSAGEYTISGVAEGSASVTITPTLTGYTFSPSTKTVSGPVNANATGQDFTATLNTYTVTGTITQNGSNAALPGVLVTATGSGSYSQTAITNASGVYTLTGVSHGTTNVSITPSKTGFIFDGTSRSIAGPVTANQTAQDFKATRPPVANNDNFTCVSASTALSVLANDTDPDVSGFLSASASSYTVTIVTPPTKGTATVNSGGTIQYNPTAGTAATDDETITFTYRVTENSITGASSADGTVTVFYSNVNDAPNAVDDLFNFTTSSALKTINVLSNDTDADGTLPAPTIETAPKHGLVFVNPDKSLSYEPFAGFFGVDSLEYKICDPGCPSNPQCDVAKVKIETDFSIYACKESTSTLSVNAIPGATGYKWSLPAGIMVTSTYTGTLPNPETTTPSIEVKWMGVSPAGPYNICVEPTNNCGPGTQQCVVLLLLDMTLSTTPVPVSCFGGSDGSINLNLSGVGVAPYTFAWTKNGDMSFSASVEDPAGLSAGTYKVQVTDKFGCRDSATATITQPAAALAASGTVTNVSLYQGFDGAVDLSVSGGTTAYSYSWAKLGDNTFSGTTQDLSSLTTGDYLVTVTDSKGCSVKTNFAITSPGPLEAFAVPTHVLCKGGTTGSIDLTPSGGTVTSGYTYNWELSSGGGTISTSQDPSGLAAGTYSVTVTDNATPTAATTILSVTITEPAFALGASATATAVTCGGFGDGKIDLTVTGGTAPYSYDWSHGAASQNVIGLRASSTAYGVTVTDANGCTATASATITQPDTLKLTSTVVNASCSPATGGSVTLNTVQGGASPYSYSWIGPGTFTASTQSITGLSEGEYTLKITDNNGCVLGRSFTVHEACMDLTKSIIVGPVNNQDGTYSLTYQIKVTNTGTSNLTGLQVTDDLAATFPLPATFTNVSASSSTFTVNGSFNGTTNTNLLAASQSLLPNGEGLINISLTITPSTLSNPYTNTVNASATDPTGASVTDSDTEPVTFTESPVIGIAKQLISGPVNNGDGSYDLTFRFLVQNMGDVPLKNVQVKDTLSNTFGVGSQVTVLSLTSGDMNEASLSAFDGTASKSGLLDSTDVIAVNEIDTILLSLRVSPTTTGPFNNSATASGVSSGGSLIRDRS